MTFSLSNEGSGLIRTTVEFTRPGNTTPYAAGAAVSSSTSAPSAIVFTPVVRQGGGDGLIIGVRHSKSGATPQNYRLDLFRSEVLPPNDGTLFPLTMARRASRIARIDLFHTAGAAGSDCTEGVSLERSIPFACASQLESIWGVLVATTAHTPGSAEVHYLSLLTLPLN